MDNGGSNDVSSAAALGDAQIQESIDNASGQVDGALLVRYVLPLPAPVPQLVVSLTTDIAAYLATMAWRRGKLMPPRSPPQLRYDRATAILAQVAAGTISLPAASSQSSGAVAFQTGADFFRLGPNWLPPPWYGPEEVGGSGPGTMENVAALAMDRIVLAVDPDLLLVGQIVRSPAGAALSGAVRWPDGSPGTYSGTESPGFPGKVDSYVLTYGQLPVISTYTQPPLTRDSGGNIVNRPAIAQT